MMDNLSLKLDENDIEIIKNEYINFANHQKELLEKWLKQLEENRNSANNVLSLDELKDSEQNDVEEKRELHGDFAEIKDEDKTIDFSKLLVVAEKTEDGFVIKNINLDEVDESKQVVLLNWGENLPEKPTVENLDEIFSKANKKILDNLSNLQKEIAQSTNKDVEAVKAQVEPNDDIDENSAVSIQPDEDDIKLESFIKAPTVEAVVVEKVEEVTELSVEEVEAKEAKEAQDLFEDLYGDGAEAEETPEEVIVENKEVKAGSGKEIVPIIENADIHEVGISQEEYDRVVVYAIDSGGVDYLKSLRTKGIRTEEKNIERIVPIIDGAHIQEVGISQEEFNRVVVMGAYSEGRSYLQSLREKGIKTEAKEIENEVPKAGCDLDSFVAQSKEEDTLEVVVVDKEFPISQSEHPLIAYKKENIVTEVTLADACSIIDDMANPSNDNNLYGSFDNENYNDAVNNHSFTKSKTNELAEKIEEQTKSNENEITTPIAPTP
jgi:hypothetical protein